jgi:hypothetical protein
MSDGRQSGRKAASNLPWLKLTRRIGTGINLHAAPTKMAQSVTG